MKYIAAVCHGSQFVNTVGDPTRSERKAGRIVKSMRPHMKDGLDVRVLPLNSYTRYSIAMFGSWNGQ